MTVSSRSATEVEAEPAGAVRIAEVKATTDGPDAAAWLAVWWAVAGVSLVFAQAVLQLGARGVATIRHGLDAGEWAVLAVVTAVFVYGEGYRALQRRYAPFVVGRVAGLRRERRRVYRLLAPLYALSLIGGPARRMAGAWAGVAAIGVAVVVVRSFPEPWRGITDFAVAAALSWGLAAILTAAVRTLR